MPDYKSDNDDDDEEEEEEVVIKKVEDDPVETKKANKESKGEDNVSDVSKVEEELPTFTDAWDETLSKDKVKEALKTRKNVLATGSTSSKGKLSLYIYIIYIYKCKYLYK